MTELYKVQKGIPIKRASKYPFWDMKRGDSFVALVSERKRVANMAYTFGRRQKVKFCVRKIDTKHLRIWRVK